jgi:Flp pilus assembly protein TadD
MTSAGKEYFDTGVEAYRAGQFQDAATALSLGLALDQHAWSMRFYLAMCYTRLNQTKQAKQEFLSIRDLCPDLELRKKATSAVAAMLGAAETSY